VPLLRPRGELEQGASRHLRRVLGEVQAAPGDTTEELEEGLPSSGRPNEPLLHGSLWQGADATNCVRSDVRRVLEGAARDDARRKEPARDASGLPEESEGRIASLKSTPYRMPGKRDEDEEKKPSTDESFLVGLCIELEEVGPCYTCGIRFAFDRSFLAILKKSGATFYCPNGHGSRFSVPK